jgi:hypothetical protein
VSRWLKVAIWTVVFSLCAGAGAYVAAHTDPFPPGVEDPGARPTSASAANSTATGSPPAEPVAIRIDMTSDTRHELHVGGVCTSAWRSHALVSVAADGTASGTGVAKLQAEAACSFPQAQVQTKAVVLRITGTFRGGVLEVSFEEGGRDPIGSQDLGGFTNTLHFMHPRMSLSLPPLDVAGARAFKVVRPDGDLGRYVSANRLHATCKSGCGGA